MKQCPRCATLFADSVWLCPECRWQPELLRGFPALAPELAVTGNGFPPDAYAALAHLEAACFWFTGRNRILQFVLQRFFPLAQSLLEIGCGTGYVLSGFARVRPDLALTGAEIYVSGLQYAQARVPQAEFIQMDACQMPFQDEFDVVAAVDVLEHIAADQAALQEIFKSVKPGGGAIITVPQHQWLWSSTDAIACHHRRYSRGELLAKAATAGFRTLWITSFVTLLLPFMLLSRLKYRKSSQNQDINYRLKELEMPAALNLVFEWVTDLERNILSHLISLPVGGSLLWVGTKDQR